jgi:diguanylate cyclase (GGDEF)-like protein/PAS domain S-box-containing protein
MNTINVETNIFSFNISLASNIFNHVSNGVTITDENSIALYANPAFTRITGYTNNEIIGQNPGMLHSGRHDKLFYQHMWQQILNKGYWEGEIWNRRKNGEIYPEFLTISKIKKDNTEDFFYIAIFSDITFLKKDISKKLHLAFYDPLTELPNRNLYFDRVHHTIANLKENESLAIFYMDLDKFKLVNDTYGHCVGDELLKLVGLRLAKIVRTGDTIARIGGDEFTAILQDIKNKESVISFAKRILETIEEPFQIDDHLINISISIGINFYPNKLKNIETLLADADHAMYDAKKNGKKIVVFEPNK